VHIGDAEPLDGSSASYVHAVVLDDGRRDDTYRWRNRRERLPLLRVWIVRFERSDAGDGNDAAAATGDGEDYSSASSSSRGLAATLSTP